MFSVPSTWIACAVVAGLRLCPTREPARKRSGVQGENIINKKPYLLESTEPLVL